MQFAITPKELEFQYLIAHVIVFLIQKVSQSVYLVFEVVDGLDVMTHLRDDLIFLNFVVENVIWLTQLHAQHVLRGKIDVRA